MKPKLSKEDKKKLSDKKWRLSHLYYIKDKNRHLVKFKPNKTQKDFMENAHTRNIILKSRQLGFTTLEAIDMLDDALFTPNFDGLLIAQDRLTAEEIFDNKIKLAWDNFRLQPLYNVDTSSARKMKFDFGDNTKSSITVSGSGRAGTYARLHITELATVALKYPEKADEILTGSIPAVPTTGRVDIESTAHGRTAFYDLFMKAWNKKEKDLTPKEFKPHFYNWQWDEEIEIITPLHIKSLPKHFKDYQKEHELTNKEITYYYMQWQALGEDYEALKREYPTTVKEAFEGAIRGAFFPEELGLMQRENRFCPLDYNKNYAVYTVWDLGISSNTKAPAKMSVGFWQKIEDKMKLIDYHETADKGFDWWKKFLDKKPYAYGAHFAPHDIKKPEMSTGKTRIQIARNIGLKFIPVDNLNVADGLHLLRMMFSRLWVNSDTCQKWFDYLTHYHREWDDNRGCYKDTPYHDFTSHAADMTRYAAVVESRMKKTEGSFMNTKPLTSAKAGVIVDNEGYVREDDMLWQGREKKDWRYQ